ncbi:MAG: tyrosine-type recombinase/integrase [Thermoleophilia bacterium]
MRGYIRKRGKNSYLVAVFAGRDGLTGKKRYKYMTVRGRRKDAEKVLQTELHRVNSGMPLILPEKGRVTVRQHFETWLESYARMATRPTTFESYRFLVKKYIIPALGDLRLEQLQPQHLQRLYAEKLSRGRADGQGGLSPRTVQYLHVRIKQGLKYAVKWGLVGRNVAELVDPPRQVKKEMKTLTVAEVQTFLAAMRTDRLFALWRLALGTGMRRGELLGLRWQDIDFEHKHLTVRQQLVLVNGRPLFQEPKTKKSKRLIPLSVEMIDVLREHRLKQAEDRLLATDYSDLDLVFAGPGGEPLDPGDMVKRFEFRLQKAGLKRVRFHDLRHTFATLALQAGVQLKTVQETLGHEDIATTGNTYQHVIRSVQEEAIRKVEDLIRPRDEDGNE